MRSLAYEEMQNEEWLVQNGITPEVAHDLVVRDRRASWRRLRQIEGIILAWASPGYLSSREVQS